MLPESPVLELRGVSRSYGLWRPRPALRDVWLRVHRGECFGLAGPNGAGKTTLIRLVLGLLSPDDGEVRLLGGSPEDPELRRRVGFVPEAAELPPAATPRQLVRRFLRLRQLPASLQPTGVGQLERLGLSGLLDRPVGRLSKGERQRTLLGLALLGQPELLILDEPTDGVDPAGRALIRDVIREECAQGRTVFLNSHLLAETEKVCGRVAILHRGRIAREASLSALAATSTSLVTLAAPIEAALAADAGARLVSREPPMLEVMHETPQALNTALDRLRGHGALLVGLAPARADLEQAFLQVASDQAPEPHPQPREPGPPLPPLPPARPRPLRTMSAIGRVVHEVVSDLAAQNIGWLLLGVGLLGVFGFAKLLRSRVVSDALHAGQAAVGALEAAERVMVSNEIAGAVATGLFWAMLFTASAVSAVVAVPFLDPRRTILLYAQPITRGDHALGLFTGVVGVMAAAMFAYALLCWSAMRWLGLPGEVRMLMVPLPFAAAFAGVYATVLLATLAMRNGLFAALAGACAIALCLVLGTLAREAAADPSYAWARPLYAVVPKLRELGANAGALAQGGPVAWWPLVSTGLFDVGLVLMLVTAARRRET